MCEKMLIRQRKKINKRKLIKDVQLFLQILSYQDSCGINIACP